MTNAAGTKFGKTEAGTVWLAAERTSPYRFYQFWLNTDDRDVIPYLKYFTWLERDEIAELEAATTEHPERRAAQRRLAQEVTGMVHGDGEVERAERASSVLFGGSMESLSAEDLLDVFEDVPSCDVPASEFEGEGMGLLISWPEAVLLLPRERRVDS